MTVELQQNLYLLKELELLAMRLGIHIRYEQLTEARSGLCILNGRKYLIIDTQIRIEDKLTIFKNVLSKLDLSNIFIPPLVREFLSCD